MGGVESQLAALHSEELSLHCCLVYLFPDQYRRLTREQGSLGFWSESQAYGYWVVQLCRPFRPPSPLQYLVYKISVHGISWCQSPFFE